METVLDKIPQAFVKNRRNTELRKEEAEIDRLEHNLGLTTSEDRLIESSLFIDKKFIDISVITQNTTQPERLFGNSEWIGYLKGRIFSRNYGNSLLTPEFITNLHKHITSDTSPEIAGRIREQCVVGADPSDPSKPLEYTTDEIRAIEENPELTFKIVDEEGKNKGFIVYPFDDSPEATRQLIGKKLEELCNWYNQEKSKGNYDPFILAGLLQHRLVSIHPFMDCNGRTSRMLMNWSLENDGEAPSILTNPNNDILTDEASWIGEVRKGSAEYRKVKQNALEVNRSGFYDSVGTMGLHYEQAFYEYVFKYLEATPFASTTGEKIDHAEYEIYLTKLQNGLRTFTDFLKTDSIIITEKGPRKIPQGGFIPRSIRGLYFPPFLTTEEYPDNFLSDVEVYRGAMVDGNINDLALCMMMKKFTGIATGYRALRQSGLPATSPQTVSHRSIIESLDYYNRMIASTYFEKFHPDVKPPDSGPIKDFQRTLSDHIKGGADIWDSPFTSTSVMKDTAKKFASDFNANHAKSSDHGILFKCRVPRDGVVLTFGTEQVKTKSDLKGVNTLLSIPYEGEVLFPGGIHPSAITQIEMFDRNGNHFVASVVAKRVVGEDIDGVEIEDRRGEYVVRKTYAFNQQMGQFELREEVATDILSSTLRPEIPEMPVTNPYTSLSGIISEQKTSSLGIDKYLKTELSNYSEIYESMPMKVNIFEKFKPQFEKIFEDYPDNIIHKTNKKSSNLESVLQDGILGKHIPFEQNNTLPISILFKPPKEINKWKKEED